jgi:hypothetical protein
MLAEIEASPLENATIHAFIVMRSQYLRGGEDRANAEKALDWYMGQLGDVLSPAGAFDLIEAVCRTHHVHGSA